MRKVMLASIISVVLGAAAAAQTPLRDVPVIDNGLFAVGLADKIRKTCPTISARYFRALSFLRDLEDEARALGYSRNEVEAHLESDAEKDRLRTRAASYMRAQGFQQNEQGYCDLGQAEIARNSTIGVLLRARN